MTSKTRNLKKIFNPTCQTSYDNLLVSGCSYTWNNSEEHTCAWPYYLRDLANFKQVYDCSQAGAGNTHIFNSIVDEIETNSTITPSNTLLIIMWSGLSRADLIIPHSLSDYCHMPAHNYNDISSTLTLFAHGTIDKNSTLESLRKQYHSIVRPVDQVLDSSIKIIALYHYLRSKGFRFIFTQWRDTREVDFLQNSAITHWVNYLAPIEVLDSYAERNKLRIPNDGHPDPNAHLGWTREILLPYLIDNKII